MLAERSSAPRSGPAEVQRQVLSDDPTPPSRLNARVPRDLDNPILLPGITQTTSPTNYRPLRQLQMMRWNGKTWDRFGDLIEGANV